MSSWKELILGPTMPPHGHCYLWNDQLVYLHVISDALITLSYMTIPIALIVLVQKRDDLKFNYMFRLFAVFIFACGATHLVNIWNVWHGAYWLSGFVKAITAVASVGTAIMVWPLLPKALALPGTAQLQALNLRLRNEADSNLEQKREVERLSSQLSEVLEERTRELDELKLVKRELEQKNEELAQSNDALQQFARVASHDLKEPLRTIASFGQLIQRDAKDRMNDNDKEGLNYMVDAANRMRNLVDDVRNYTALSQESEEPRQVDLTDLADRILKDLSKQTAEHGVQIQQQTLPLVQGLPFQLSQLMQNLLSNAIKFSRDSEPPVVEIGPLIDDRGQEHGFYVRDNGIGIAEKDRERIFGVFERVNARDEFEGTGIGLAICKRIIDTHHGRIEVLGDAGEGTEFRVWLPMT